MQSSIGRFQLKRLEEWISIRNRNAKILTSYISELKQIRVPIPPDKILHSYYKYYCYVNEDCFLTDWNRDRVIKELQKNGFPAYSGSCSEIYLERCFKNIGLYPKKNLRIAAELGKTSIMFLVHPTLSIEQMNLYGREILSVFKKALK